MSVTIACSLDDVRPYYGVAANESDLNTTVYVNCYQQAHSTNIVFSLSNNSDEGVDSNLPEQKIDDGDQDTILPFKSGLRISTNMS